MLTKIVNLIPCVSFYFLKMWLLEHLKLYMWLTLDFSWALVLEIIEFFSLHAASLEGFFGDHTFFQCLITML